MNKYHIRFNKSRGQPNRGSIDHVWRIFENGKKEYLVKNFKINTNTYSEVTGNGAGADDWNIACEGFITFDKETSTAIIHESKFDDIHILPT
jgi:hypothetical protein